MKTTSVAIIVWVSLALLAGTAAAKGKEKRRRKRAKPTMHQPAPSSSNSAGSCTYRQGEDGKPTTIKDCSVSGGAGEFEVLLSKGQVVVVRVDEPIAIVTPDQDPDVAVESMKTFLVYDLINTRLPAGASSVIQTTTMTITLRFRYVATGGDTQVHITRSDRAGQDAEVERRAAARRRELQDEYDERYAELDARALRLANQRLLTHVHAGVSRSDPDVRPTRHDFVVLRAEDVVRIGTMRFLQVSVENRSRPTLHIATIQAWLERGGNREPLDMAWKCGTTGLRGHKKTRCTLALSLDDRLDKSDRVRVRVQGRGGRRAVALGGIDVR